MGCWRSTTRVPGAATSLSGRDENVDPLKYAKAAAAVGVSVIDEVQARNRLVVRPSKFARRVTLHTPMSSVALRAACMQCVRQAIRGERVIGTLPTAPGFTPGDIPDDAEENFHTWFVILTARLTTAGRRHTKPGRRMRAAGSEMDGGSISTNIPNETHRWMDRRD